VTAAIVACLDCATARARCRETGDTYVCTCGRRYRARMLVYRADPDGATPQRAPLDRAGHAAVRADDPDLARVRRVLAELRPDCADPMEPPPPPVEATPLTVRVHDPSAAWGGIPRGLESGLGAALARAEAMRGVCAADVLRAVDALAPDARAVLRWMRAHATLRAGLRGLYVDAAVALSGDEDLAAWRNLNTMRSDAPKAGARLVLRAVSAWDNRPR